jgi:hypothetical protein
MDHRQSPCCAAIEKEQQDTEAADKALEEQYLGESQEVVDPPMVEEAPAIRMPEMPKPAKPMPTLSELVDKIPVHLKALLADQLRGEFKDVRLYDPQKK